MFVAAGTLARAGSAGRLTGRLLAQPDTLGDGDCEALREGMLGQPVNTLSSLGYVAGGIWLATRVRHLERRSRLPATAYAAFVALSGAGSVAYHGPQFAGAQLFHDLPIVGMVGLGVGVPVVRLVRSDRVLPGATRGRLAGAVVLGAASVASYFLGRSGGPACDPESLLQPHGLWHLGTAALATLWATVLWSSDEPSGGQLPSGGHEPDQGADRDPGIAHDDRSSRAGGSRGTAEVSDG